MKIKTDFVTNSSSTSYVLEIRTSGSLPRILTKYGRINIDYADIREQIKHNMRNLFNAKNHKLDFTENYYYPSSVQQKLAVKNEGGGGFNDPNDLTPYTFTLMNYIDHYDETWTSFHIVARPDMIEEGDLAHEQFVKTFQTFIDNCVEHHSINIPFQSYPYISIPYPNGTGGWDGGDPYGKYTMTHEVMEEESRMGHLIIVENKVTLDLKKLGESFSVLNNLRRLKNG